MPPQPVREPEDIFNEVDASEPTVKGPAMQPIRPMGSPTATSPLDSASPLAPGPVKPGSPFKPVAPRPAGMMTEAAKPSGLKKIIKIIVIIVIIGIVLAGLAAAGWFGLNMYNEYAYRAATANMNANVNQTIPPVTPPVNTAPPVVPEPVVTPEPAVTTTNDTTLVNTPPPAPLDTDRDGLMDTEEALYGTDINNPDTDNDELTDRDEVIIFKTDPLNPDSDGDSYLDGEEIQNGYDPNGPGKLLKINQ